MFPPRSRSLKLFQQRKPSVTTEWQSKLPDFVRRLEEALYRSAASKVRDVSSAPVGLSEAYPWGRMAMERADDRPPSVYGGRARFGRRVLRILWK